MLALICVVSVHGPSTSTSRPSGAGSWPFQSESLMIGTEPTLHDAWHTPAQNWSASATQSASHAMSQQYASCWQTEDAHASQDPDSAVPVAHAPCVHPGPVSAAVYCCTAIPSVQAPSANRYAIQWNFVMG